MSEVPANEKLWQMVVFQAKTKYHPYPSPGASNWVHKHYIQLGGTFTQTNELTKRKKQLEASAKRRLQEKAARRDHDPRNKKEDGKKKHGDK
jgi:hypothetical protein